jgi:hypothetical protein
MSHHDNTDIHATLEELWSTPVGRRWVLKAGLGSLAAGLAWRPSAAAAAAAAARAGQAGSRRLVSVALQFALDELDGVSGLVLIANGERIDLRAHTSASRSSLRAQGGLWRSIDLSALSHYVEGVRLPAHRASLGRVEGRRGKHEVVVSEIWHTPAQATLKLANASHQLTGTLNHVTGSTQRLNALGLDAADLRTAEAVAQLETVGDGYQTASALTMTHPNIATIDPDATATTKALLGQTAEVTTLGSYIGQMQRAGRDFATLEEAVDPDGTPSEIQVGDIRTTFSTIQLNQTDVRFHRNTRAAVSAGITGVRDDPDLGAVIDKPLDEDPAASTRTWVQPQGVRAQPLPYGEQLQAQAGVEAKLKNNGFLYGTRTVLRGGYNNGQVPVRLYNNFVRWMWAYVQYLGADGTNLSTNPHATLPDTEYSQSIAVIPPVFTVLGVPLWDTNTVEFTLDFPPEAHTARLLYCGLGSDINGGGWRQYFPTNAYKNQIAPTDEVWIASAMTGILCIGLNVFALATDIDIALTWKQIRSLLLKRPSGGLDQALALFKEVAQGLRALENGVIKVTAAEGFARLVLYGGATYADVAHRGENVNNLWNLLLGFASVIPKLIFNPKVVRLWSDVGKVVWTNAGMSRVVGAIPMLGQVFGVVSAVGDALTLAEVGAETVISPWVIENEVSLSYPVTVTVSRDPRSSTFPASARSWRLEALVDGAVGLAPITGQINEGGRLRSDPLVLSVSAPFGGKTIQWSVVFLDEDGMQVGTGVSAQYPNRDPNHPASSVSFAITQLPVTISDKTVFKRAATTTYSAQAGGYTWSDQVSETGTALSAGIQDVTGAAVATLAGVAGMVWKEDDRFFLRGVPLAQNGSTIKLGVGSHEGWERRPFLLLDAFVDARDEGNHVLLEPDHASPAYHVRPVTLDAHNGAISWDPSSSLGTFTLPVSAAALHSSGMVVAINTDSGRLAVLEPAVTPRPQLATYAAGEGDQIGLLRSPLAVAVTNPGVVLVLEAGSTQLSAFDLNLDPVRYFGRSRDDFSVDLVSPGTYLDLAVDGASQIYALYFTGTGATAHDYHIDVYSEAGDPIATHSPGTNTPQLAVDYWRSIYAPNYNPLTKQGTITPHIDPRLAVREPSLSRFNPTRNK